MDTVTDPTDPRLRDFTELTDRAARLARGRNGSIFIVEGALALDQLLKSARPIRAVVMTPNRLARLEPLLDQLTTRGAQILVAEREVLRDVTGFDVHRGILASADREPMADLAEVAGRCRQLVVVEGVNDHENIGSVFRNAAALGFGGVVLDPGAADPLYRRSIRVSLGWSLRIPFTRVDPLSAGLGALGDRGFSTIALTPGPNSMPVDRAAADGLFDQPFALVLGAEGPGLSRETIRMCDAAVRVPMSGEVDSLNVATTLAVVGAFAGSRRGWT